MKGRSSGASDRATGALIPVWRDVLLDTETAVGAFARLRGIPAASPGGEFAFLLESAPAGSETWARYTFLGTDPRSAWRLTDGVVEDWDAARGWHNPRRPDDPFEDLRDKLTEFEPVNVPELGGFWGGAVGYFGYDLVRHIERLPHAPPRGVAAPDALFAFTGALVIIDNLRAQARVVSAMRVPRDASAGTLRAAEAAAHREIDTVVERLRTGPSLPALDLDPLAPAAEGRSTYGRAKFLGDVRRIKDYIVAGDVYQTLLARRIVLPHDFDSTSLYRSIRALNPSPYMYHLALDGTELVGSSPELQVRVIDGMVIVRPIAGTRARGRDPAGDAAAAADLLADGKERAEHVMLVDLGRNDVGRVAEYGSVHVTELMKVETYSHVMHMVSQVEGRLAEGCSALDVLRATFPAGTMSGAPKVRAMEIIDELEPERRGPYSGAVGYIAYGDRRMDLAITIRTCVIAGGEASVQAGAGIVADSIPEAEWEETESKARAMLLAIGRVRAAARSHI
ncbi:MAG TPA: anthranilate synthase component I family protein [Gemmatimonadaceae bacterium]|nr:anthranilate synthase component I family protein [Gemmatimonadaceae bacterium]